MARWPRAQARRVCELHEFKAGLPERKYQRALSAIIAGTNKCLKIAGRMEQRETGWLECYRQSE